MWPDLAGELGKIVGHNVSHRAVGVNQPLRLSQPLTKSRTPVPNTQTPGVGALSDTALAASHIGPPTKIAVAGNEMCLRADRMEVVEGDIKGQAQEFIELQGRGR